MKDNSAEVTSSTKRTEPHRSKSEVICASQPASADRVNGWTWKEPIGKAGLGPGPAALEVDASPLDQQCGVGQAEDPPPETRARDSYT